MYYTLVASQSHERLLAALTSILELQAIGIEAETRLEIQAEAKEDSAMSEAAGVFGPLIPLVVDRLGGPKVTRQSEAVGDAIVEEAATALKSAAETGAQAPDLLSPPAPQAPAIE